MSSYNYLQLAEADLGSRFSGFAASDLWRNLVELPNRENLDRLRLFEGEISANNTMPKAPRVFISHRQADKDYAIRAAELADQSHFEYWLDVLDPQLQVLPGLPNYPKEILDILIAGVIEMALINCTHVLAVMTNDTAGSLWVPYEYGRITKFPTVHGRASAWKHPDLRYTPEYMLLGKIHKTEASIRSWFADELTRWPPLLIAPTCITGQPLPV